MIGDTLRSAREARELTLEKAAVDTRIAAQFLQSLEDETFEGLPAPVYVRGFLRSYAAYLGLDAEPLLEALVTGGASPPVSGPDAFVGGPNAPPRGQAPSSDPFQTPPPQRARGVVPMGEEEFVRYDPGRGASSAGTPGTRPVTRDSYGSSPVPGVLIERAGRYNEGSIPRGFAVIALGLILIVVLGFAAFVLATGGGDDDDQAGLPANPVAVATATVPQTVISLESATAQVTGTGADPAATTNGVTTPGATSAPGETTTQGATPAATATTASGATAIPATETPSPTATETPTAVATATPTVTPVPTPVPPSKFEECDTSGSTIDCGPLPWRVVCVRPGVWFIDVNKNYAPLPTGWTAQEINSKGAAADSERNGCSA